MKGRRHKKALNRCPRHCPLVGLALFFFVLPVFLPDVCPAAIPPIVPEGWVDGRLAFGNGLVFGTFVSPMEEPSYPYTKVCDRICRLWFDYGSPQQCGISLQPCVQNYTHAEAVQFVEGVDQYEYLDSTGIVHMVTDYAHFTVHSYTYAVSTWSGTALVGKPALVRKITVVPKETSDLGLRVFVSLYPEYTKWVYHADDREDIPSLTFPGTETVAYTPAARRATWDYSDSPRNLPFKKLCLGLMETPTQYQFGRRNRQLNTQADYSAENAFRYGGPNFKNNANVTATGTDWANACFERRQTGSTPFSLTLVIACGATATAAQNEFNAVAADPDACYTTTHDAWQSWLAGGSMVTTGQPEVDKTYKNALVFGKMSQAANGGIVIGGRYQIMCYWIRDMMVGVSCLLDTGFYEDARQALDHIRLANPQWDTQYNCLHPNYHISGRWDNLQLQPGEWTNRMAGPQLDGMGDYLYCMGKYYRHTGDLAFINQNWAKIDQITTALIADNEPNFDKYRNGLLYDGGEGGSWANETAHNARVILGIRTAYDLSVTRGSPVAAWKNKADALEFEFFRQLVDRQEWKWTPQQLPADSSITIDENTSHTGRASLRIINGGSGVSNICSDPIPITAGEPYTFEIYSKSGASAAQAYLRYLDSSKNVIFAGGVAQQEYLSLPDRQDFGATTTVFTVPQLPGLAYVDVLIQVQSSSRQTAWFDDVSLVRAGGTQRIANPSFEEGKCYLWDLINRNPPQPSSHAAHGYPLYMGTIFPYLDPNKRYIRNLVELMSPNGDADGWGMWTCPVIQASSISHDSDKAWNYLWKLTAKVPGSHTIYEQNDRCLPATTRVEDLTDPAAWTRNGGWTEETPEGQRAIHAGGTGQYVQRTLSLGQDSYVSFVLRYWAFPNQGIAEFSIDGAVKATIDQYRTTPQWVDVPIGTWYLSSSNHTIRLSVSGRTNHSNVWVNVGRLTMQYPNNIAAYKANTELNGVLPREAYVLAGYGLKYPAAVFCTFAGFNPKEQSGNYKIEPQIPVAFDTQVITSRARVKDTVFNVQAAGRGDYPAVFTMDGSDVPSTGLLPSSAFDKGSHSIVITSAADPPGRPYPVLEDTTARLVELSVSQQQRLVIQVEGQADHEVRVRGFSRKWYAVGIQDQVSEGTTALFLQADEQGTLSIPLHCGPTSNRLTVTIGPPRPDFDGDTDVDQADFGFLQQCVSGDGIAFGEGCAPADLDSDGDVDEDDFGLLHACLAGADGPPGC